MDPIQLDKLRVHPEEINQATGRIRINSQSQDNPTYLTRPLWTGSLKEEEEKEAFGDLHRIWFPILSLIGFIVVGVLFFISHQRIATLEKKILELTSLQNKSQKEMKESIHLLKSELHLDKVSSTTINELKGSLKDLETKTETLQKKIDSFHLKEVLILESDKEEISTGPASKESGSVLKP